MGNKKTKEVKKPVGAVLVVGGGIAGIQSSLDLAESGYKVYLLEKEPSIGGHMPQLDKTFPTNDCAMCILAPKLVECGRHPNIELITYAELEDVEGEAGNFKVKIKKLPGFVDFSKCTGCSECEQVCPVQLKSEFNEGLDNRHAIYRLYPQAIPNVFTIEKKEEKSPCKVACPAGVNAQGYTQLISQGKFQEALNLVRERNPFPGICGRVCPHPCEEECLRSTIDSPVAIRTLKRFIADYELTQGDIPTHHSPLTTHQKKVAIIGGGPGGLTTAYDLRQLGYQVTIFEKHNSLGGMMRLGIPAYRLPRDILQKEIDSIIDSGIEVKLNTEVGKDLNIDDLQKNGFEAIFLATGAHSSRQLGMPGEDLNGVIHGVTFLRELNLGKKVTLGNRIAVIGGGNVAMDSARSALRLGCKDVSILYRRSRLEMPADPWEIEEAEEEGIKIHYLVAPTKISGQNEKVQNLECIKMELGKPDSSGRRRPVPIEGSEFTIEVDTIIPAIGQSPELSFLPEGNGFNVTKWGTIEVDPITLQTSKPHIFAGGDLVTGPLTVIDAIAQGHEAAISIDRYLQNKDLKEGREKREEEKVSEVWQEAEKEQREEPGQIPIKKRITNFDEIEECLTEEQAIKEANRCLSCSICSECMECVQACKAEAVDHQMKEKAIDLNVGSIILAPGFDKFDPRLKQEYGYGRFKNVVTSLEFERILSASGPFAGHLQRLSDGKEPKKIAFIQCVGSRDCRVENEYCSSVCCTYAIKEAIIAKEHAKEKIETTIFYMDIRTFGKGFEQYYNRARDEYGVRFANCRVSAIEENTEDSSLLIRYENNGQGELENFDMVVLSVGLRPPGMAKDLADRLGIELNKYGFCKSSEFSPLETSREGIFVAGAFQSPKDIPETVAQAQGAAGEAGGLLVEARGSLITKKEYPPEIDATEQEPRIGVFICHCGINIAGVVDVESVEEYAASLPGVVYTQRNLFTCSQDTQERIKETIKEYGLNRVVVASCSPRTHEPLFQQTIREAGLNPYLFEMANIRDQCSWVHQNEPEAATEKAKVLVRMAVVKAALQEPLQSQTFPVTKRCLIIGGGLTGMTSSLALAQQGFEVYLVEKESELGGNLRRSYYTLNGEDPQAHLRRLGKQVNDDSRIEVFTASEVVDISGYVGNFKTTIGSREQGAGSSEETHPSSLIPHPLEIEHGAIIVAAGGQEYKPEGKYLYGEDERVITQRELEERLGSREQGAGSSEETHPSSLIPHPSTVVMIHCVGSRDEDRSYCSRICCQQSIKNAIKLKELNKDIEIFILYKDMRTYGFMEEHYRKARESGVVFIRYDEKNKPEVKLGRIPHPLEVEIFDSILKERLLLKPDLVVLNAAIISSQGNEGLSKILKITLDENGFFLEAHPKLRPLDFSSDGIFLAGLCHSPKLIGESISQALGAAGRAVTLLSRDEVEAEGVVSVVDPNKCAVCLTCIRACPYDVPFINDEAVAEIEAVKCHGCGICAADCPAKTIELMNYKDSQIVAKTKALLA